MALCKAVCHYEIFLWVCREKKKSEKEKKETCLFKRELPDGGIRPN